LGQSDVHTVPTGKSLVITDIVAYQYNYTVVLQKNGVDVLHVFPTSYQSSFTFAAGVRFPSGSVLGVYKDDTKQVTLMGYEYDDP
jgi:hypothetical protein